MTRPCTLNLTKISSHPGRTIIFPGRHRAATHVFNRYMAKSSSRARHAPGKAVQQFLNCLMGGTGRVRVHEIMDGEKRGWMDGWMHDE